MHRPHWLVLATSAALLALVFLPTYTSIVLADGVPVQTQQTIESDDSLVAREGAWTYQASQAASDSGYLYSSGASEDALTLHFEGTAVDVVYVEHPAFGSMTIEVDGVVLRTVITSGTETEFGKRASIDYLEEGTHTLRVYPADGTIGVDAFVISGIAVAPELPVIQAGVDWYVAPDGDDVLNDCQTPTTACATVQGAVDKSGAGDMVHIAAGTYTESVSIGHDLSLHGDGSETTILDGTGQSASVVTISPGTTVEINDLAVQNGANGTLTTLNGISTHAGSGIYNEGNLTLNRCDVSANTMFTTTTSAAGGGIFNAGTLTITDSTIVANELEVKRDDTDNPVERFSAGGGIYNAPGAMLVMSGSQVTNNEVRGKWDSTPSGKGRNVDAFGGGIFNNTASNVTIEDSILRENIAEGGSDNTSPGDGHGGGVYNKAATLTIIDSEVIYNEAEGGTFRNELGLYDGVSGNGTGGAIAAYDGSIVTISGSLISSNRADGGWGYDNTINIRGRAYGGGIAVFSSQISMSDAILSANNTWGLAEQWNTGGGGLFIDGVSAVTITTSTIDQNSAENGGGILQLDGELSVTQTEITFNFSKQEGGGIASYDGTLVLFKSLVHLNTAVNQGGGIYTSPTSQVVVTNSTVSSNTSADSAIYAEAGGWIGLFNSTITGNIGGGVNGSGIEMEATIVAGNLDGDSMPLDCQNSPTSNGHNIFGQHGSGNGCTAQQPSDSILAGLTNSLLTSLGDNGGPTRTHALISASVAVDAIPVAECTYATLPPGINAPYTPGDPITEDQRGFSRPFDGDSSGITDCDIGAVEGHQIPVTGDRYVAPTGDDTANDCRVEATPCQTINHALEQAYYGDTIFITAGTYNEALTITRDAILQGAGPETTILDGTGLPTSVVTIPTGVNVEMYDLAVQNGEVGQSAGGWGYGNYAGAGIFSQGNLIMEQCDVSFNSISGSWEYAFGAGIFNQGVLTIRNSSVSKNSLILDQFDGFGGGIFNSSDAQLILSSVEMNDNITAGDNLNEEGGLGGAIASWGQVTISDSEFARNIGDGEAGAIYHFSGQPLIIDSSVFAENESPGGVSGALSTFAPLTRITDSSFTGNTGGSVGAIVMWDGTLIIAESAITNNIAYFYGGVYIYDGTAYIANSTVSHNTADFVGGIALDTYENSASAIYISSSTVAFNSATYEDGEGGIYANTKQIYLKNTVVTGNTTDGTPDDCDKYGVISYGHNIFGSNGSSNDCPTDNPTDTIPPGPPESVIQPLADNGGPTLTHALTNGSPAIDAVPAAECTLLSSEDNPFFNDGDPLSIDQRGQPRPFDGDDDGTGECDSGAFEVQTAAPQPPDFSKAFANEPIPTNTPTTLTFTVNNPALNFSISNLAFVDDFPTGMTVATPPNASNTCGGTFSANAGASSVSLSGGSIAPDSTCTLAVDVIATMPGTYTNTTGHLTSDVGNSGSASVEFTVVGPVLPTFSKAFADDIILPGEWTTLTFTIDNPNTDFTITDLAFVDDFPADMVVAATPNITNTCGGTFSADAGASSVSLSAGELATDSSCTISVDVMANSTGTHTNTTSDLTSDVGNSGPATADIIVFELIPPLFEKAFSPAEVVEGEVTTLTFSIDSTTNLLPVGNLAFTDDLPGGMTVTDTPNINNTCGGTVSAEAGASTIGLTGGEVAAEESCTIQVDVLATQPGMHTNTTSDLTSDAGNSGPATADLLVNPVPAAATLIAPQGMINMLLPVYRWEDVPNATEFDLRLDGPDGPIIQQILLRSDVCTQNTCEFSSPGGNLTNGASYTWTVIPRNAFGEGPSSELTFMVSLGSTQLISPQGAIVPNRPVFTWEEAPATTYYRLQVNGPGGILHDAWHPSTDICASSICQFQMDDYLINYGGANFSWQVQSYGPDYTPWPINGPLNFSVGVANPSTPAGTITGAVNHLEFGWSELAGAAWYQLYLNGPAGYVTDQWVSASQCGAGTCTYTLNMALSQSGDYQWYVRAWEPAGYGSWSIEQNFTLSPSVPPVITKLGPTGTVTDLDVEFSWVEAPTAASYELYIAGPDGFSSLTTWNATAACEGGTCTATVSLPGNGAHTWYLRGINGAGGGPWGPDDTGGDYGGVTFNVDVPAVSQVTKLAPISGQNLTSGQVTFEWQADANATHYELYIAGPDGFTSHVTALPADEICAASPCAYAVLLPHNGPYTWYLRAIGQIGPGPWGPNDAGGDYGAAQFTVNAPVVGVVSKISPSAGQVLSNIAVPFEWQPEPNASSYGLYVAGPDGFIHYLTYPAAEICGATCLVEVILPYNDAYTWYLQGISAAGGGPWGPNDGGGDYDGVNFSLNAPSPEPVAVLESPADGTIITSSDPLSFEWAAVDNATWYQFVLADSQTHAIVASEWYSAEAAGCATGGTCTVTRHPGVGSYRWQVLAWGPGASGVPDFNPNSDYAWRLDKLGF